MARFFKYFLLSLSTLHFSLLLSSCQEGREAGDLWGQWRIDNSDSKYISFSGSIVWFRDLNMGGVNGIFQHSGDSLFIQCYSAKGEASDTINVENIFGFKPFNNIRLKIVTLDNDHLVLSKESQTWTLDKY